LSEDEFQEVLRQVCDEWNKAERAVKLAENVNGEIVNPSIFELRYAGRRLIEAFQKSESERQAAISLLRDAKFDCHRSQHDAIDAATSKMAGDLTVAVEFLPASIIMQNFPAFSDLYGGLNRVRQKVALSRENRDDRDAIYETIQSTDLPRLVALFENFKSCEDLMVKAAEKEAAEKKWNKFFGWTGIIIGSLAVIIALVSWIFS
jgi:hypothetical protein